MKRTLNLVLLFTLIIFCNCSGDNIQKIDKPITLQTLKEGDLLFIAKKTNNPITDVTQGVDGLKIDHVAIYHKDGNTEYALEAIPPKVVLTPISKFIERSKGKNKNQKPQIVIGRVKTDIDINASIKKALSYIGRPYDFFYMPDDKEIYCSELVQKCYVDHKGNLLFTPIPMSFHDKNGKILKIWEDFYRLHKRKVPEGEPGSNPGDLSRRNILKISYDL